MAASSGAMTGAFIAPISASKTEFTGVIQPKLNIGAGFYLDGTTSAAVLPTPQ